MAFIVVVVKVVLTKSVAVTSVAFTFVVLSVPKDALDINELETSPINSKLEPLPLILTFPNEPVEMSEPLMFPAFILVAVKVFPENDKSLSSVNNPLLP